MDKTGPPGRKRLKTRESSTDLKRRLRRQQEELRESEGRYRTLFETMTEGLAVHEIITDDQDRPCDYRFLDVNPAFERLTGLKRADLLGKRVLEVMPGIEPYWIESYGRVALTGQPQHIVNYSAQLDRWYEVYAYQVAPGSFAAVFTDVTEHKRAERQMRKDALEITLANRILKVFVEEAGEGLFINALDIVLEGLGSEHGVFGYIDENGDLVCPSMTRVLDRCEVAGKCIRYPRDKWKGLWSRALLEKRSLFTNEPPRVPAGHVAIRNNLAAPILFQGEAIGLLNLANKDGGYTEEDRKLLDGIAGRVAPVLYAWIQRWLRERERADAERALWRSGEDLARAQAIGGIGSWRLDIRRNLLTWSDENHRIFGVPKGQPLTYETFLGVVHPDDRRYVDTRWKAALRREPYDIEHRIVVEGEVKWVREKAYLEFNDANDLLGGFGITQDITGLKRAEEALQRSEARFKLLSRTAGSLLATSDPQGQIEELCREVMEHLDCQVFFNFLVDWSAGRLHLNCCAGVDGAEAERIKWLDFGVAICGCVARDGVRIVAEDILNGSDSRTELLRSFGVQAYCCHPLMAQDRVIGTLAFGTKTRTRFTAEEIEVMRSVTDQVATAMQRVQAAEALRSANAALERKVEERTAELAGRVAQLRALAGELTLAEQRERRRMARVLHDHLQQVLVAAKFHAEMLGADAEPLVKQTVGVIEKLMDEAIRSSRSLTADLSPPVLHEGSLDAGLEWLAQWMRDRHGLIVELSMDEDLPGLAEDVKILLFESVRELLFNTVKHAAARSVTVLLRRTGERELRITVSDAGPGFDPAGLKKAGEWGGGFGLFSIRERLDLIGGRLEIDSAPGQGSRFRLTAPVHPAARPLQRTVSAALPDSAARPGAQLDSLKPHARIRVLLADDHAIVREGLRRLLGQDPDIEVVGEAADGREAVELAGKLLPDLILMDLSLPWINGVEATRTIHEDYPGIRIIGFSMFEEKEGAQAMLDAGAVAYLTKSGPSSDLIAAIKGGSGLSI